MTHEARVQRLMAGATTGDQRHLAFRQCPAANEFPLLAQGDDVRMCGREAV
jgi:hypothetical protein